MGSVHKLKRKKSKKYRVSWSLNEIIVAMQGKILCEAGILPGVLIRNKDLKFRCEMTNLLVQNTDSCFTNRCDLGQVIQVPISHGEGNYYADKKTLKKLKDNDQIIFSYCNENGDITNESNPNGSLLNIAGITNKKGNVVGLMPHPDRVSEKVFNNTDGIKFFKSVINYHNY